MKIKQGILLIFSIASMLIAPCYAAVPPQANGKALPGISIMLNKVLPAIVNVTVMGETRGNIIPGANGKSPTPGANSNQQPVPFTRQFQEVGSGVVINAEKGYVITNAHVVMDAKIITVMLSDGRRFKARLIGSDKLSDIAVLQINAKNLTAIPFGDSDILQVGDFVAAIGNPFGLHQTVTTGIVSALHRSDLGIEGYENFIQTDASINPGNSGGGLLNLQGELVGINTALIGPIGGNVGIGLAIPSNMVKAVVMQLITKGKVERGVLGVMVQDFTPALADAFGINNAKGALVTNVSPGSPAEQAGLKSQDIILNINGTEISDAAQLRNMMGLLPIGTKVAMQLIRNNKTLTVNAVIIDPKTLKQTTQPGIASFLDGVRLTTYDQLVPNFGAIKGVGVLDVDEMSNAWISGLRPGDVILNANGQAVTTIDQLLQITRTSKAHLLLKIGREEGIIFLVINNYG